MFIIWGLAKHGQCLCGAVGPFPLFSGRLGGLKHKASPPSVFSVLGCVLWAWQGRLNLIKINGEKEEDKSRYEYSQCLYASSTQLLPASNLRHEEPPAHPGNPRPAPYRDWVLPPHLAAAIAVMQDSSLHAARGSAFIKKSLFHCLAPHANPFQMN